MSVKIPSEVSTRRREEMVCPNCFHEGLQEHPGYVDEYEGEAEILRATRCPNDECKYHFGHGVPVEAIEMQYERQSRIESLLDGLDIQTIGMVLIMVVGALFLAQNFLGLSIPGLGGGGVDVTVGGQVLAANGEPIPNASVELVGSDTQATTGPNGWYQLANLTDGSYVVSIDPPASAGMAASAVYLNVSDSGDVVARGTHNATLSGTRLNVRLKEPVTVSRSEQVVNGTFLANFSNPKNAGDGVQVTVSPPPGDTMSDSTSIQTGQPQNVNIPGIVTSQEVTLRTSVVTQDVVRTRTWGGNPASVSVLGNIKPSNFIINVSSDSNDAGRVVEETVSDGSSFTETVHGGMNGPLEVTLWGGSASAPTVREGTYSGSNPTIDIGEQDAPAQVNVEVTGSESTSTKTDSGTVQNGYAAFNIDGTLPARDAVINFKGGTPENAQLAEKTVSADGGSGTDTSQKSLFTASSSGSYRLDFDYSTSRNGNLVEAGYKVNGELTTIETGTSSETLDLASGDSVSLWIEGEQESFAQEKDYTRKSPVRVVDQTVSSESVQPGESVRVGVTMENTGDSPYSVQVRLFKDGEVFQTQNKYFSVGERDTFIVGDVSFSEEGAHTVSVNEGDQISVQVGSGTPPSGAGSLTGAATRLGDGGMVNVDTNGDGSTDCSASANGGSCSLGGLSTGQHEVVVSQEGVTGTGFEVSYTARDGPQDVEVDIDSDGVPEIDHDGGLNGQTLTGSASLGAGTNAILFDVGNGGSVEYTISWTQAGQVTEPEMYIDGQRVIDVNENFKGERSFTVDSLDAGSHTFEFASANASNEFNVRLEWAETGDALYPTAYLDGTRVCRADQFADDLECNVSASDLSPADSYSLRFEGGGTGFTYGIAYTARATPETVTLTAGDNEVQFLERTLDTRQQDGSWVKTLRPDALQSGQTRLSLETPSVDGLNPSATATIDYTYTAKKPKNPKVVVVAGNQTNEKTIPQSSLTDDGVLAETTTVTLPTEWFTFGENEVRVVASNGGVMNATVTSTMENEGAIYLPGERASGNETTTDESG